MNAIAKARRLLPQRALAMWTALVAVLAVGLPQAVTALETPAEQMVPDQPPYPVKGLVYHLPGLPIAVGAATSVTLANPTPVTSAAADPQTGRFLRFAAGNAIGSMLVVNGPTLIKASPSQLNAETALGSTLSFWYRHPLGSPKVKGWNPLIVFGDDYGGENWKHGVVLSDGVPIVARRGATELFDAKSIAAKTAGNAVVTGAIDDGGWHHIALRYARPGCQPNNCPAVDRVVVSLFVDGKVAGEEVVTVPADVHKLFVGALNNSAIYAAQNNWDNTNKRLNTIADIDDVLVYNAALSMSELHQLRWSRVRGLAFQWPPVDPVTLGATGPNATVGQISATTLPSKVGPIELNKANTVVAPGLLVDGRAQLEGVGEHSLVAWTSLAGSGSYEIASWEPTPGKGWRVSTTGNGTLRLDCRSTAQGIVWTVPNWTADSWHLLSVRAAGGQLVLSFDQRIAPAVTCADGATTAGTTASLQWPSASTKLTMAAMYRGARSHSELAAIAAPGPALWLKFPSLTNLSSIGVVGTTATGSGSQFAVAPNVPGTLHRVVADLTGMWLAAIGQPKDELTVAFDIRVDSIDPTNRWITPVRRYNPANENDENFALTLYCQADNNCSIHIVVPDANGKKQGFYLTEGALPLGKTTRVAIAWPLTRVLLPAPGQTGATLTVVEPGVTLNGVFVNRRYSTDPNKLTPLTWWNLNTVNAPAQGVCTRLQIGSRANEAGTTKFTINNFRAYPRAIDDSQRVGATCAEASCGEAGQVCEESTTSKTAVCTNCTNDAFRVGGVGPTESDCRAKLSFGEACRADVMCASGVCNNGRCAATQANLSQCQAVCLELGRACTQQGSVYACGGCLSGFETAPGQTLTSPDAQYTCGWSPKKKWRDTCDADWECASGACREVELSSQDYYDIVHTQSTKSGYDNDGCTGGCSWQQTDLNTNYSFWKRQTRKAKVCLAKETAECTDLPWKTSVQCSESVTLPGGQAGVAHYCATSKDAPCATQFFARSNPVLSPGACQAAAVQWQQVQSGSCHYEYCWSCFSCENNSNASAADSEGFTLLKKNSGLSLGDLKRVFLNDGSAWKNSDVGALRAKGVGPLLIQYAAGTPQQKQAMTQKYGKFEPLIACAPNQADWTGGKNAYAFHRPENELTCMPVLQDDGAACPPPGETLPGKEFCKSNYCNRQNKICERGDNPMEEVRGKGGNEQKSGKSEVKFGLVRVDDTEVKMEDGNAATSSNEYRYTADLGQRYVPCILGKGMPEAGLFAIDISLDRSNENSACHATEVSTKILGIKLTSPKPEAALGSCTGYSATIGVSSGFSVCEVVGQCEPVNPANLLSASTLAQMRIPTMKFCAPWEEMGLTLPEAKKDFKEFLVPLYISIGLTLDACISYSIGLDESGLPQLEFKPNAGVGVEAKGGVGLAETGAYEFGAGVRLALTLVDIAFPITWGIVMADFEDAAGKVTPGLLKLEIVQKISLVLELLNGEFGLFAEFSIGPLSFEWVFNLFTWKGLSFNFELSEIPLFSTTLDFTEQFYKALQGAASQACAPGPCYQ